MSFRYPSAFRFQTSSKPSRYGHILVPMLLIATFAVLSLIGCSGGSESPADPASSTESTPPPASEEQSQAGNAPAPGLSPVTSRNSANDPSAETIQAPGALFTLPAGWIQETPSSSMRLAQAEVPGADGAGKLTVFYFGPGGGGPIDENLDRWVAQMEVDPGSQPTRESFETGAFKATWTQVHGTLKSGTMGGPADAQPNFSLLGAVVEGDQGPWFFKITGPAATLDAQKESFLNMLRSVRSP